MGQLKDKEIVNADTTSEQPKTGKKARKLLKTAAKKLKKKSSKVKVAGFEKINTTEDSKQVKNAELKLNGSTPGNAPGETTTKETKAITKEIEANTNETFGGFIFMCNTRTKPDCFRYKVLGLPEARRDCVFCIKPGMKLFLYDFDLKLLYGIFKASSVGGMKLEPAAFSGLYPAQVRFEVESARGPLPYHIFKDAIKDNFTGTRNMFKTELSVEQVNRLAKLFPPLPLTEQQQQVVFSTNAPMLQPAPVSAAAPARAPAPAPARAPAPAPARAPAPAPARAPGPAPAPFAISRPTNLPVQASIHSHPFENLSRNHTAPIYREQAPGGNVLHNPLSLTQESYRNLAAKQNPFMVPVAVSGNAPAPFFAHPYAQLLPGSLAPQPAPQFIVPYDMQRISSFGEGPSYEPMHGVLHLTRATDAPTAYNIRNEQRVGNENYLGPPPVSSRYAFAGPTVLYRSGLP